MNYHKILFNIFFIVAFIYLVMCPSVHELGDTIRHDVTLKVGAKILLRDFKKGFNFTFSKLFTHTQNVFFVKSRPPQELPIISSLHSSLKFYILSTTRLILWLPLPKLSPVPWSWYRNIDIPPFYKQIMN